MRGLSKQWVTPMPFAVPSRSPRWSQTMDRDRFTEVMPQAVPRARGRAHRIELLSTMPTQSFRLGLARVGQAAESRAVAPRLAQTNLPSTRDAGCQGDAPAAVPEACMAVAPLESPWPLLSRRSVDVHEARALSLALLRASTAIRQRAAALSARARQFDETYRKRVYHEDGLVLFEDQVGDVRVSIRLVGSREHRCEGDVTVFVRLDGQDACYVSYSFVDAACFGLSPGKTMFVTRSQLMPAVQLFRRCYPHSSPQYFCLAAIAGIALANDMDTIAVIKSEAQVCYQAALRRAVPQRVLQLLGPVPRAQHRSPGLHAGCAAERAATGVRAVEASSTGHRAAQALGKHHSAE